MVIYDYQPTSDLDGREGREGVKNTKKINVGLSAGVFVELSRKSENKYFLPKIVEFLC